MTDSFLQKQRVKGLGIFTFSFGMTSTKNKTTRITQRTATAINHTFSNILTSNEIHAGVIKTDISDNFLIYLDKKKRVRQEDKIMVVMIEQEKQNLRIVYQSDLKMLKNANVARMIISRENLFHYVVKYTHKNNFSPWIIKGIKKSSRRKQRLCKKFLKKFKNEQNYRTYEKLFESVIKR